MYLTTASCQFNSADLEPCNTADCIDIENQCSITNPCENGFNCDQGKCVATALECSATMPCAINQSCDDGTCVDTNLDCGTIDLQDNFDDNVRSDHWIVQTSSAEAIKESSGTLQVTPLSAAYYISKEAFDMNNKNIFVHVPQMLNTANDTIALFMLRDSEISENYYLLYQNQGDLIFGEFKNASLDSFRAPYDPSLHAFWRIRVENQTVFAETKDKIESDWKPFYNIQLDEPWKRQVFSQATIYLGANNRGGNTDLGTVHFDNFNVCP